MTVDPGGVGAGSVAAAAAELIGPLAGAATPTALPWGDQSTVEVEAGLRYPLALVTLLADLELQAVVVTVTASQAGGAPQVQAPVRFEPWTSAGSALPGFVPAAGPDGLAGGFKLSCAAERLAADGTAAPLDPATVVRIDLVQGVLGRVLAVLLTEKARLRRAAREITAVRALDVASGPTLDRIGADLRCPRFRDELVWDAERGAPGAVPLSPPGTAEDDVSYRSRLRLLRGTRLPSPAWVDTGLNGSGGPSDPGTGWLADAGTTQRVAVDESANPLYLAFRLVAPGDADGPAKLLQAVRGVHLIWPAGSAAGDAAHSGRMLPPPVRARADAARAVLAGWQLPADQPIAPSFASAMQALDDRCRQLGARPWPRLLAGQSDDGGSRFELGLGGLLAAPDTAALDVAIATATALHDPDLVPRPRDADPAGIWLLSACGFRTAELLADTTVFVSAAPMGPLVIDLTPPPTGAIVPVGVTATLVSPGDARHDAPMAQVVDAVTAHGTAAAADPAGLLAGIQPASNVATLAAALADAGFVPVNAVQGFLQQLAEVSPRDYAVFDLGAAATAQVLTDTAPLEQVLDVAARAGASSVAAVVTAAGTLALVLGVTGLPLAGSNLAGRHTILFRWQVRRLGGNPVDLEPRRGPSVQVRFPGDGISLLSSIAYVRTGANDPYEWQPRLDAGTLITLRQYEHLMNIAELVTPAGVRADTWDLRQHHVDVDGSGQAHPLTPSAARSYRHYRST